MLRFVHLTFSSQSHISIITFCREEKKNCILVSLSLSSSPTLESSHKSPRFASIFDTALLPFLPFSVLRKIHTTPYIYALSPVRESGKFLMGVLCGAYQPRFIQEEDILGLSWLANWFCILPRTVGTSARFLPPVVPRGWFSWTSRWTGHPGRLPSLFYPICPPF